MARRLVEAGVRCVTIDHSNWDTHDGNFATLKRALLPLLDCGDRDAVPRPGRPRPARHARWWWSPASSAARRGSTRTPAATTGARRSRWLLGGGGIKGGRVVGKTDARAEKPGERPVRPGGPVRDDVPRCWASTRRTSSTRPTAAR